MEVWKDIPEYEGLYQVSDLGRVRNNNGHILKFRKIAPKRPYYRVGLTKNNKQIGLQVHRLVMITFKPIHNTNDMTVDHIDGNQTNNALTNLRWLTPKENLSTAHRWRRVIKFISNTELEVYFPKTGKTQKFCLVK